MRFEAMRGKGYLTPIDRFFVRNHTATPEIDPATWRLRVHGTGIRQQGTPAAGTQWTLGAIGVASWTGVRLSDVLDRARLTRRALDVMPVGLDSMAVRRPIPVEKALARDTLLVVGINGDVLPPDHGFPVRLLVPGWIGVANVKWVGSNRSWSGEGRITKVEVAFDDSRRWRPASLARENSVQAWRQWSIPWHARPGQHTIRVRARDDRGNVQPTSVPFNEQGYLFGAIVAHPVTVE